MDKTELLHSLQADYREWEALLEQIGPELMEQPGVAAHWSMKDMVAHLAGPWQKWMNTRLQAAQRGEPDPSPPWPANLKGDDEINAWIEETNRNRPAREVLDEAQQLFQEYFAIIESLPDDVMIAPQWRLVWLGDQRFPAGEFFDHYYDDHQPDVLAWLARVNKEGYDHYILSTWKRSIWQQFGAAIDTLDNALRACPDELWRGRLWNDPERAEYGEFWFLIYHTLKWLDLYLNGTAEGFAPPARFQRYEKDADGLPLTPYTKGDLQAYLGDCRQKCQTTIEALTGETAQRPCYFEWIGVEMSFVELLLYSMRHVQEHGAQLNLMLGQKGVSVPDSVARADERAG
jgi:uncharacterized damage-inducible protein DinB